MGIESWSKTPASNTSAPPDGAPEGQLPGTVNDIIRQQMADHRTRWEDAEWFNWGHVLVRQGNGSFLVSLTATQIYTAGRRLKLYDSTTIYAEVLASGPSGANTLVSVSSSNLSTSLSSGAVGILNPAASSMPTNLPLIAPAITNPVINGTSITGSCIATQTQMETPTDTGVLVSPAVMQYHPGMCKAWVVITGPTGAATASHACTCARSAQGIFVVSWTTAFSSGNYAVVATPSWTLGNIQSQLQSTSVSGCTIQVRNEAGNFIDPDWLHVVAFGDT